MSSRAGQKRRKRPAPPRLLCASDYRLPKGKPAEVEAALRAAEAGDTDAAEAVVLHAIAYLSEDPEADFADMPTSLRAHLAEALEAMLDGRSASKALRLRRQGKKRGLAEDERDYHLTYLVWRAHHVDGCPLLDPYDYPDSHTAAHAVAARVERYIREYDAKLGKEGVNPLYRALRPEHVWEAWLRFRKLVTEAMVILGHLEMSLDDESIRRREGWPLLIHPCPLDKRRANFPQ